jgi:uncharacterized protein YkwD
VALGFVLAALADGPDFAASAFAAEGQRAQQIVAAGQSRAGDDAVPAAARQLFALANQARAAAGVWPLKWDAALAAAALQHCQLMAIEGPIAHRYNGEPDLTVRAQRAGAHYSLIEENVAFGSNVAGIHQGWLNSPGHRANLLNPEVDSVGIAVVAGRGAYYAAADYAHAVQVLSRDQVEATVAELIRASGISIVGDPSAARNYCETGSSDNGRSGFFVVWEGADISALPRALAGRIGTGSYRTAVVGACAPKDADSGFTSYRVAVILY